jgi:hypothetical protein
MMERVGMQEQRANALVRMSEGFLGDWQQPSQLYEACSLPQCVFVTFHQVRHRTVRAGERVPVPARRRRLASLQNKRYQFVLVFVMGS